MTPGNGNISQIETRVLTTKEKINKYDYIKVRVISQKTQSGRRYILTEKGLESINKLTNRNE
jgi:hypothetical protein